MKIGIILVYFFGTISYLAQSGVSDSNPLAITYTGNMGTLIKSGSHQILIDGLHLKYEDDYLNPPDDLLDSIIYSKGSYRVDVILVTHVHADHFNAKPVIQFLQQNKQAKLIAPEQVMDSLRTKAGYEEIKSQLLISEHTHSYQLDKNGVSVIIGSVPLLHTWQQRHSRIDNYGYTITAGFKKIIHVGDAEANDEVLKSPIFSNNNFDAAIVPSWFMAKNTASLTAQYIKAKQFIITHISPLEKDTERYRKNASAQELKSVVFKTIYQTIKF